MFGQSMTLYEKIKKNIVFVWRVPEILKKNIFEFYSTKFTTYTVISWMYFDRHTVQLNDNFETNFLIKK